MPTFRHGIITESADRSCKLQDHIEGLLMLAQEARQQHNVPVDLEIQNLSPPSWILRPIDDGIVGELARSIENIGLLQPIMVRRAGERHEVVFGNHRLEACRRLGFRRVQAIVTNLSKDESFIARVSENLLRNTRIDPIQEAEGYKMLLGKGWTINAIAKKVGKSDSYICERLAILDRLDDSLRLKISKGGHLTPSHGELLSRIPDPARQREVAGLIERKRLSVRSVEDMLNAAPPPAKVLVEDISGNCYLRIPEEFVESLSLRRGQHVYLYERGKKLILENADKRSRGGRRMPKHNLLPAR